MRATLSILPTLAAAALAAAASPAGAQRAAVADAARPAVRHVAPGRDGAVRTVATYRLAGSRDAALLAHVTVADSAGVLVAGHRLPGASIAEPMTVTVLGADLVLQGETPSGVLTLQLIDQNGAGAAEPVRGRWSVAGQRGELRGREAR